MAFSGDGRSIATTSRNRDRVQLVDIESGELLRSMVEHESCVCSAVFSVELPLLLASGYGPDGSCKVWDSSTGALLFSLNAGSPVISLTSGRDWVRDEKCVAFAMGHTPRLGAGSRVLALEVGVVRMILDRV